MTCYLEQSESQEYIFDSTHQLYIERDIDSVFSTLTMFNSSFYTEYSFINLQFNVFITLYHFYIICQ